MHKNCFLWAFFSTKLSKFVNIEIKQINNLLRNTDKTWQIIVILLIYWDKIGIGNQRTFLGMNYTE